MKSADGSLFDKIENLNTRKDLIFDSSTIKIPENVFHSRLSLIKLIMSGFINNDNLETEQIIKFKRNLEIQTKFCLEERKGIWRWQIIIELNDMPQNQKELIRKTVETKFNALPVIFTKKQAQLIIRRFV